LLSKTDKYAVSTENIIYLLTIRFVSYSQNQWLFILNLLGQARFKVGSIVTYALVGIIFTRIAYWDLLQTCCSRHFVATFECYAEKTVLKLLVKNGFAAYD
jgi:hypothetical protein|tara:strand:- start:13 stop:315 length:303 start_codon:yes stop_codon:yes gene_type:complete